MIKFFIIATFGLLVGILTGIFLVKSEASIPFFKKISPNKQVIGFLPYWQIDKASQNDDKYITELAYFAITVGKDGHIVKLIDNQQEEPGWYDLQSDKLANILRSANKQKIKLSLVVASGDANAINALVKDPVKHAQTLVKEAAPIMKNYHFTDLNLDIEDTAVASIMTQNQFTQFIQAVKQQLDKEHLGSLSLEISPTDAVKNNLINIAAVSAYANTIVIMAYDYHSPDSIVTGPVSPLSGAGIDSEYDVITAVEKVLQFAPANKVVLGMPLYGYEWETLNNAVRSAIIPGTGVLASNNRAESFLITCASCSAFFDNESQEVFAEYLDTSDQTIHQISFPNKQSVEAKLNFANKENLSGVALWALGYEGDTILTPLLPYK
jgi:spore germination protein YaaH